MPNIRPLYPLDFRQQMLGLVRTERTPREPARLEPRMRSIELWIRQSIENRRRVVIDR